MIPKYFSKTLLSWFDKYGRKNLPWQINITPYRVWVSEIMLQQTQVNTVTPYFIRFIERFPTLHILAIADLDEVLHYWTGLGYYARARNMHHTAKIIMEKFAGEFPKDLTLLQTLPGIGRSTAGAILAIASNMQTPILDGNVKRVLTRLHAIEGGPGSMATQNLLWQLAEKYTPQNCTREYTQAIMDLGATICTRAQPSCEICPFEKDCISHSQGNEKDYPTPKKRISLSSRETYFLIMRNSKDEIMLEKRPPQGIWGGLWSFPECPKNQNIVEWCTKNWRYRIDHIQHGESFRHTFSHFHLEITPVYAKIDGNVPRIMDSDRILWYKLEDTQKLGLAAPVKRLLTQLYEK